MDSLKRFLKTLDASLHLVQSGHSLGTDGLRRIVRNYEQDVVQALGSLSSRVRKQGDKPTSLNKAHAGLEDSSDFTSRYPAICVPALRPLESSNSSLAASLDIIRCSQSSEEFHTNLEQELDKITAPRELVLSPLPSTPTRSLQSWNLLQEFMADAGL